jgi:UDPglucose--hexose-1-phosphate uridylyltransferase
MPELRKDPIVGRWVIIAHERARRPHDFKSAPRESSPKVCPFCEGNEAMTPPEILAYRDSGGPNSPGWRVRVVPNRFPALQIEGELEKRGDGMYDHMAGVGAHEVIIESPDHHVSTATMPESTVRDVLWAYRDRLVDLKRDRRMVHGMLFKNVGENAGASLEHAHSQLIVTPIVPISVWEEMTGALEFYNYRGRCIYCDMVRQETGSETRVVLDTPHFTAFCPYASRFPFETWIVPKSHESHFENIGGPAVHDLSHVLHQVLGKLEQALDAPSYNYIVHTAPFDHSELPHYHWHIEVIPRLTKVAGFEWGSGFYINPVPPEQAAAFLREVEAAPPAAVPTRERPAARLRPVTSGTP